MEPVRHLEVTDEDEARTLCGSFPGPAPGEQTLTTDPAAVTCEDCRKAYVIARIEHLALGRTAKSKAVADIMGAEDAKREPPDGFDGPGESRGTVARHVR
jgi:hypothetical protein